MNRRSFLRYSSIMAVCSCTANALIPFSQELDPFKERHAKHSIDTDNLIQPNPIVANLDPVILNKKELKIAKILFYRIRRVQDYVGYGYFNLLNFDQMIRVGRRSTKVGRFSKIELALFEELFYTDAKRYGFFGEKVFSKVTESIIKKEVLKVPYTGHYLYKDRAYYMYKQMTKELKHSIILTSGVRGIVKQMYLFLNRAFRENGNLSIAARNLAPAGYSFHGIGDFDVGKKGYGFKNFTDDFAKTDEYKKLMNLGYVEIRYTKDNPFGVRFEPWHVKVNKNI